MANESRLGQVFLNLIVNAAQAIPVGQADGNEITRLDHESMAPTASPSRSPIPASASPTDKLERVFDPFFTTKPAGIGTGLGPRHLPPHHHRARRPDLGSSTVGSGTMFRVVLRRAEPVVQAAIEHRRRAGGAQTARKRGRILVVDDEPALCKTIERMLRHRARRRPRSPRPRHALRADRSRRAVRRHPFRSDDAGNDRHGALRGARPKRARTGAAG